MKFWLILVAALLAMPAQARPVVVELFTSEACSSCPPAEELLAKLKASDPDILPLSFHVTYWDGPGWTDKYGLKEATDRQSWYAGLLHSDTVYTPEAVVDGAVQVVGSNRADLIGAIGDAQNALQDATAQDVPVTISDGSMLTLNIGAADGQTANIWLIGFDPEHKTPIGGGENGGVTVTEVNVVRSLSSLGTWMGIAETVTIPKPAGARMAVILQTETGQILGAASD
jgi:hypothetical protein